MKKSKSVYQRMYHDKKLFFLGFGVLYITEMRGVRNLTRTSELRIKSKELAETWYGLFRRYNLLSKKSKGIHVKNGIYTFGCSVLSLYELLNVVKNLPETEMDLNIRRRLKNITYTGESPLNKNRIKILGVLKQKPFLTNELARKINFCSGNVFMDHLNRLVELDYIKREKVGKQKVKNWITRDGISFINNYINNIENVPTTSLYYECFKDKQLSADLILIISELEMGGIMQRAPYLQMTSKDFVKFILEVCKKWRWTNHTEIKKSKTNVPNWKPKYSFFLSSKGTKEIYTLAGPCADIEKNKEFENVLSLRKPGSHRKINETKEKILKLVENNINTSRQLAFELNIGIQNIQRPLANLVETGKLKREKISKGYVYELR